MNIRSSAFWTQKTPSPVKWHCLIRVWAPCDRQVGSSGGEVQGHSGLGRYTIWYHVFPREFTVEALPLGSCLFALKRLSVMAETSPPCQWPIPLYLLYLWQEGALPTNDRFPSICSTYGSNEPSLPVTDSPLSALPMAGMSPPYQWPIPLYLLYLWQERALPASDQFPSICSTWSSVLLGSQHLTTMSSNQALTCGPLTQSNPLWGFNLCSPARSQPAH